MKTIELRLYKFDELSELARKKAIQYEHSQYQQYGQPLMFFEDYCKERAKEFGFNECKFQWSLSNCQGDGLSFSCSDFDLHSFLINHTRLHRPLFIKVIEQYLKVEIKGNTDRYCYAHRSDIDVYLDTYHKEYNNIQSIVNDIRTNLEDIYLQLCKELEAEGYRWIEAEMEDEAAIERIEENDDDYRENGTIYH